MCTSCQRYAHSLIHPSERSCIVTYICIVHGAYGIAMTYSCVAVTWLKEPYRELTYSKRHRIVTAGDHHFLVIKSSISTDAGRFIAVAENDLGKIQTACWVNVKPPRVIEGSATLLCNQIIFKKLRSHPLTGCNS